MQLFKFIMSINLPQWCGQVPYDNVGNTPTAPLPQGFTNQLYLVGLELLDASMQQLLGVLTIARVVLLGFLGDARQIINLPKAEILFLEQGLIPVPLLNETRMHISKVHVVDRQERKGGRARAHLEILIEIRLLALAIMRFILLWSKEREC
jgi:hypothetical protein